MAFSSNRLVGSEGTGIVNWNQLTQIPSLAPLVKTALNASDSAPIYACRAWVNFNGTGTVAIRASGNVSSITDNGTGDYTVNFATAMVDSSYVVTFGGSYAGTADYGVYFTITNRTATSFRVFTSNDVASARDYETVMLSIFR